jgi:hypothetical protein
MFFLLLLVAFLWVIKADIFFMVFGTVVLMYFLIMLFFMDPLEVLLSTFEFILLNPLGILILIIPLVIYLIFHWSKKRKGSNGKT